MTMLGNTSAQQQVMDLSQVAEARRSVAALARDAGFEDTDAGRATLVASEMATNLVKHAGGGWLIGRTITDGVELLAVDQGPGMADPVECLRDGFSTAGSAGTGLGAIRRLSEVFDLFTRVGAGTVVLGRLYKRRSMPLPAPRLQFGAVSLAIDGEELCGDGWSVHTSDDVMRVAVFDGLGHGPLAREAAEAALAQLDQHRGGPPAAALERVHHGIRHTRGAAGAVYDIDPAKRQIRYAGVGNIAGTIIAGDATGKPRALMSHNGTLGHMATRFQEFTQPWVAGDLLVVASDGLTSRWDLSHHHGLGRRDPAVVAAVLWRDFRRGRDDVTVVVVRES